MTIKEKIDEDLKQALKERDKTKILTLRMLKSNFKNAEIAKKGKLTDDEIIKVIGSEAKKHREAIDLFKKGNRDDLAEKEKKELKILIGYLPKQLNEEEIKKIIQDVINNLSDDEKQNFGRVMSAAMKAIKGQADGSAVSKLVKAYLEQ